MVTWYRYYDEQGWENPTVKLQECEVIRETERCVILKFFGEEKRVLKNARRRWAYPTKELALNSYIIRKRRQAAWAQATVDHAKAMLHQAELIAKGEALPASDKFTFGE